jgi:hypothetical protein
MLHSKMFRKEVSKTEKVPDAAGRGLEQEEKAR